MRVTDIIAAKRDGRELDPGEVARVVCEYACGTIPDYQMSAFLMAVYLKGMTFEETAAMTRAMVDSGKSLDLSVIPGVKIDKHSTGGVGDKTTLVVVPVLTACGLKVPKMSGRGLGFTGGTLDKLESIPGFGTALSVERFVAQVSEIGAAIAGQTADIVPADKKIYALRDVTATVDSIPLIAASVMGKKLACSADVILLDVKVGSGAFMPEIDRARELARTMIEIGQRFGRRVGAMITDMSQPLGSAVGNALEVAEAMETLRGGGPDDFRALCIELSAAGLTLAGVSPSKEDGRARTERALASGEALSVLRRIIGAQGGDPGVVDDPSILPHAQHSIEVRSESTGFVSSIDCAAVGRAASILGAGRQRREDKIDPAVGIVVLKKIGDHVGQRDPLAVVHYSDASNLQEASSTILNAYSIGAQAQAPALVLERLL